MNTAHPPTSILAGLLQNPLPVTFVNRRKVGSGAGARDMIVTTSRFVLILEGRLQYRIEAQIFTMEAGTQFFIPAWTRRDWSVVGTGACEIVWVELDDAVLYAERGHYFCRKLSAASFRSEKRRYFELLKHFRREGVDSLHALMLEGLVKAMLSRFWMEAESSSTEPAPFPIHSEVKVALRYLEHHYADPDPLTSLYRRVDLTENYLRKLFKEALQSSPQQYLQRLRMRHARHLVQTTDWQFKRIASEVGYQDPLYFSRHYCRFWGNPPSSERVVY